MRTANEAEGAGAEGTDATASTAMTEHGASGHFMYVLECADGTLYTGYTVDVERRVSAHNAGKGAKYTAARRPVRLLARAAFATKHDAMSAEARFKRLPRAEKMELVEQAEAGHPLEALLAERFHR